MSLKFITPIFVRSALFCTMAVLGASCAAGSGSGTVPTNGAMPPSQQYGSPAYVRAQIARGTFIRACQTITFGQARCMALGLRDTSRVPRFQAGPNAIAGFGPPQLQAAYNIVNAAKQNKGGLVALVEANGYPSLESDLAVYRKQFGLPKCTTSSGCLRIVNQKGKPNPLPSEDPGWDSEQALDVDMVSANCPKCTIVVVQASTNLYSAEKAAVKFHPVAISNSWGGGEYPNEVRAARSIFRQPGIAITASAGDDGYGVIFPSSGDAVVAIGGTSLFTASGSRGYSESVWGGSGSGCSQYVAVRAWQKSIENELGGCTKRIVSDVAYVGNPDTGVATYDTVPGGGEPPGWQVWGGTSVGAPAIAAIYALSGDTAGIVAKKAYANPSALYDVTTGSNGNCSPPYLCTGEVGYDGPTGLGTPNGLGAF
ncbi:MAG TPA: hypothetical protein VGF86_08950 [Candidatus Tumulicola sp.]|jgi:subtilase family serine protease